MMDHRLAVWLVALLLRLVVAQFDEYDTSDGEYRGKLIGSLNSYHHQVNGHVYAVDQHTLLIRNFVYDGNGKDTFFWAGGTNRPGSQGFIVPNEKGRTNVLNRYLNDELTVTLPEGKRITDIKWFSVYDISLHEAFGDIYIPEDFEPPEEQVISDLQGFFNGISSSEVVVMDAKTLKLRQFHYEAKSDGAEVYFWVGVGPQPSSKGSIVADELGYFDPLRSYNDEDVELTLPGQLTIFDIQWFSIYDKTNAKDLGHVLIPDVLNVPPALVEVLPVKTTFPNCMMLHANLMVAWSVFAPSITIQLSGLINDDDYMAFGVAKPQGQSNMVGSDVAVAYIDGYLGYVDDYNVTAKSFCNGVLGVNRGVCKDENAGGTGDNQIQSHKRENGITEIIYRKTLTPTNDPGDSEIYTDKPTSIVWAIGRLAQKTRRQKEPTFHHIYTRRHTAIDFGRKDSLNECIPFTTRKSGMTSGGSGSKSPTATSNRHSWGPFRLFDPTLRTFDARLGPSGGQKGYSGITGLPSTGYVWYINGYMVPELYVRRGLTYVIRVEGGKDPYSAEFYHPMVITTDPLGGYDRLSEEQRKDVRILAGVELTRRLAARPTASGRLCLWKHREGTDRRLDDNFVTFERYRNSLKLECEEAGDSALLTFTPNVTWPDVVYYQSYSQPYMGWKINIVDDFNKRYLITGNSARTAIPDSMVTMLLFIITVKLSALLPQ